MSVLVILQRLEHVLPEMFGKCLSWFTVFEPLWEPKRRLVSPDLTSVIVFLAMSAACKGRSVQADAMPLLPRRPVDICHTTLTQHNLWAAG